MLLVENRPLAPKGAEIMGEQNWKSSQNPPEPVHQPGTPKGEELPRRRGKEAGRYRNKAGEGNRPAGKSRGEASSRVAPSNPIDPNSPTILAP